MFPNFYLHYKKKRYLLSHPFPPQLISISWALREKGKGREREKQAEHSLFQTRERERGKVRGSASLPSFELPVSKLKPIRPRNHSPDTSRDVFGTETLRRAAECCRGSEFLQQRKQTLTGSDSPAGKRSTVPDFLLRTGRSLESLRGTGRGGGDSSEFRDHWDREGGCGRGSPGSSLADPVRGARRLPTKSIFLFFFTIQWSCLRWVNDSVCS